MSQLELTVADLWATGISPDTYPTEFLRAHLTQRGARPLAAVSDIADGTRILVGGAVTHRQRPAAAGGITFLNLEDETGMFNIICSPGLWARYRTIARASSALLIRGRVQRGDGGVTSLLTDHLEPLDLKVAHSSRDFR